jgi:hypothetical protein
VTVADVTGVTVHVVALPAQSPVHPTKTLPDDALAVSVTGVPAGTDDEQLAPQLIPGGLLVTVPEPVPVRDTDTVAAAVWWHAMVATPVTS